MSQPMKPLILGFSMKSDLQSMYDRVGASIAELLQQCELSAELRELTRGQVHYDIQDERRRTLATLRCHISDGTLNCILSPVSGPSHLNAVVTKFGPPEADQSSALAYFTSASRDTLSILRFHDMAYLASLDFLSIQGERSKIQRFFRLPKESSTEDAMGANKAAGFALLACERYMSLKDVGGLRTMCECGRNVGPCQCP